MILSAVAEGSEGEERAVPDEYEGHELPLQYEGQPQPIGCPAAEISVLSAGSDFRLRCGGKTFVIARPTGYSSA
jgi:hypothetical protein